MQHRLIKANDLQAFLIFQVFVRIKVQAFIHHNSYTQYGFLLQDCRANNYKDIITLNRVMQFKIVFLRDQSREKLSIKLA